MDECPVRRLRAWSNISAPPALRICSSDRDRKLAYRGQFDASRPGNNRPVTGDDLHRAVQAVLAGQPVPGEQVPSVGCNIKWKPGNEPEYRPA